MSVDGAVRCRLFSYSSLFSKVHLLFSSDRPLTPPAPKRSLFIHLMPIARSAGFHRRPVFHGAACKRHQLGRAIDAQRAASKHDEGVGEVGGVLSEEWVAIEEKPSVRVLTG